MPPAMSAGPKGMGLAKPSLPRVAMRMVKIQEKRTMTRREGAPKVAPRTARRSTSPMPMASRGIVAEVVLPSRDLSSSISIFLPSTRMWVALISRSLAEVDLPSMLRWVRPSIMSLSVLR